MDRYKTYYSCIYTWFQGHPRMYALLKTLDRFIPCVAAVLYLILILRCIFFIKDGFLCLKVFLIPLTGFIFVTVFRRRLNVLRPYTKYHFKPLIAKEKAGESFPSRHVFSITVIAMSWLYVETPVGILLWVLSVLLAATRVLGGVHYLKDVAVAALISVVFGFAGFWLF